MLKRIRARFSSAHVLAGLALFIVLGGSAIALKKGAVGTRQLERGAVTTKKIAKNAVTGKKVAEETLGTVPSADKADSALVADSAREASHADDAANASALQGRQLSQVRGQAEGTSAEAETGLPVFGDVIVASEDIDIPVNGGSLVATATVELAQSAANSVLGSCELFADGTSMSQLYSVRLEGQGDIAVLSLTGFTEIPNAGTLPTSVDVTVGCAASNGSDGDVDALGRDLVVQQIPTG